MRKVLVLVGLMILSQAAFSQPLKVIAAWNQMKPDYMELDKAMAAIDEAIVHPKTRERAKTWYYRGLCYYNIYKSADARFKNLHPSPLNVAYDSFLRAVELDQQNKLKDLDYQLSLMATEIFNRGSLEYDQKKYREAVESFEKVMSYAALPFINQTDTALYFNAAIAADRAGLYDKAIEYYRKAIEFKDHGTDVFHYLAVVYKTRGDTLQAIQSYMEGIEAFPESNTYLYIQLINHYLEQKDLRMVAEFVVPAVEKEPKNKTLWNVYGIAFEGTDKEQAAYGYEKAIELDSTFFDALYNLGTLYYNQGVDANSRAVKIPLNKREDYAREIALRDEFFHKALPYYEQAIKIEKNSGDLLIALKEIYYRFQETEKLNEILKLIELMR